MTISAFSFALLASFPSFDIGPAVGLAEVDGELWGVSPDYKALFTNEGFVFTPALGRRAGRNRSLSFSLESIRRGETVIHAASTAGIPPRWDGLVVRYERGAGIVESYEVRGEGIEQAFRFESLPAGSGDLVVRGRIATDLPSPLSGETAEGARFEIEGLGGVSYGGVTGIDANGARAAGRLRLSGNYLELVLPAEFVDSAAPPILLDPVVGSILGIAVGTPDEERPDVAYDATNEVYLVVWERHVSAADSDIYGLRVASNGLAVGSVLPIEVSATVNSVHPSVANVNQSDRFLVAWQQIWPAPDLSNVAGRTVSAADGSLAGSILIAGTTADETTPDVGGDPRVPFPPLLVFPPHALVVWDAGGAGIRGRIVSCPAVGSPTLIGGILGLSFPGAATDSVPAVSKSCGGAGRWLVVWERFSTSPVLDNSDILGKLVLPNGTVCGTATENLHYTAGPHESNPDCAGDGTNFVVAYEYRDLFGPGYDSDIHAKRVTYAGTCASGVPTLVVGPGVLVAGHFADDEIEPAIGLAGPKYLVSWARETPPSDYDLHMAGLDAATAGICEPESVVDGSAIEAARVPAISARQSGATLLAGDEALLVWQSTLIGGSNGDIRGRRVEAIGAGGPVVNLGGGCGGGGMAGVNGPAAVANSQFAHTLTGAAGSATGAVFVLGVGTGSVPCGPCNLVPTILLTFPATVTAGAASVPLPIPCDLLLLGATIFSQWVVFPAASPCPTFPAVSLSNALSVSIGL